MSNRLSWFGVLMIAIVSGLIVKIVGDPVVEVTTPAIEDFLEDWGGRVDDAVDDFEDWFSD